MIQIVYGSILFFSAVLLQYIYTFSSYAILYILLALLCSLISLIWNRRNAIILIEFSFLLSACIYPELCFYLPLLYFTSARRYEHLFYAALYVIPLLIQSVQLSAVLFLSTLITLTFGIVLKHQYQQTQQLQRDYKKQRDATRESVLQLDIQNRNLRIHQEQEIRIATLDERNRIAREIHDNVGHLLSSALLQIGALQAMQEDSWLSEPLENLRATISTGMDHVRKSVHDLHETSLDLETALQKLIREFTFCETSLLYDIIHPLRQVMIYQLLTICKECMNNTMKHSNATHFNIQICEQPAFYQFIFYDNGTNQRIRDEGIGLYTIRERVNDMKGYVNITNDHGFKVFITLMKEELTCV